MAVNAGEVRAKITGDASSFTSAASSATSALGGLTGAIKGAAAAGTAFAGLNIFKNITQQAIEFETKMSDISTLIQTDVNEKITTLRREIIQLSNETPTSADELGASAYDVLSAGIDGATSQMKVLREANKLGIAGLGSTEESVDLLTTALNSFNFEAEESGRVANVFFETVREGKNRVSELSDFFGQVAPQASKLGISFEELNATTAVMTRRTGNARKAQRGLRQILSSMLKPSDALKKTFQDLGVEGFQQLIEKTGTFTDALNEVKKEAESEQEFQQLVGSARAVSSAMLITGEQQKEVSKIMKGMSKDANELEKAFKRQAQTTASELSILQNRVENFSIKKGERIAESVNQIADATNQIQAPEGSDSPGSFISGITGGSGFSALFDPEVAVEALDVIGDEFGSFTGGPLQDARKEIRDFNKQVNGKLAEALKQAGKDSTDVTNDMLDNLKKLQEKAKEEGSKFEFTINNIATALKKGLIKEGGDALDNVKEKTEDLGDESGELDEKMNQLNNRFDGVQQGLDNTSESAGKTKKSIKELAQEMGKASGPSGRLEKRLGEIIDTASEAEKIENIPEQIRLDELQQQVDKVNEDFGLSEKLSNKFSDVVPGDITVEESGKFIDRLVKKREEDILKTLAESDANGRERGELIAELILEAARQSVEAEKPQILNTAKKLSNELGLQFKTAQNLIKQDLTQGIIEREDVRKAMALGEWKRAADLISEQMTDQLGEDVRKELTSTLSPLIKGSAEDAEKIVESEFEDLLSDEEIKTAVALDEWDKAFRLINKKFEDNIGNMSDLARKMAEESRAEFIGKLEASFTPGQFLKEELQAPAVRKRLQQMRQQDQRGGRGRGQRQRRARRRAQKEEKQRPKPGQFRVSIKGKERTVAAFSEQQAKSRARKQAVSETSALRGGAFGIGIASKLESDTVRDAKADVSQVKGPQGVNKIADQTGQAKDKVQNLKQRLREFNRNNQKLLNGVENLAQELSDQAMQQRIQALLQNSNQIKRVIKQITNN